MMTSHLSLLKLCLLFVCFLLFTSEASALHGYRIDDTDMMMDPTLDMDNTFGLYKRNRELYCGQYLILRLKFVCKSIYKRKSPDSDDMMIDSNPMTRLTDMETIQYPFIARHAALNLKPMNERNKRGSGIVDECCKKSCTVQEMASYCG